MNGPILNFEVFFYAYQTEFQLNVSSPPDFDGDEARAMAGHCICLVRALLTPHLEAWRIAC